MPTKKKDDDTMRLMDHVLRIDACLRVLDRRSMLITSALTGVSVLMVSIRSTWQSDVTVTAHLAGLATMVAVCIPLTYLPLAELHAHVQLQRHGTLRSATVLDQRVNAAGFMRWRLEIAVPTGVVRKWAHYHNRGLFSAKHALSVGSVIDVTLTDDWVYCRVENSNGRQRVWRTTLYLATLILVSVADTIESLYFLLFGVMEAVSLLRQEGCSRWNIGVHLLFCVVFGGAICAICHSLFWKRRYAGLPSVYAYEFITPSSHRRRTSCHAKGGAVLVGSGSAGEGRKSLLACSQVV